MCVGYFKQIAVLLQQNQSYYVILQNILISCVSWLVYLEVFTLVLKCDKRIFCSSDLISGISSDFTPQQHGIFCSSGLCYYFLTFFKSWMLWQCLSGYQLPKEIVVKSGKFQKLDEMLPKLKCEGHRVLIFSQFVIMLDVLQEYLHIRGYRYLRLDGSTPVTLRCVWKSSHLWLHVCNININILIFGHLITYLSAQRWW